jgi:hypothetical protein
MLRDLAESEMPLRGDGIETDFENILLFKNVPLFVHLHACGIKFLAGLHPARKVLVWFLV